MKSEKRRFSNCRFTAETVKRAIETFDREFKEENEIRVASLSATVDETERGHDDEAEFFADYRKDPDNVIYRRRVLGKNNSVLAEMSFLTFCANSAPVATVEVEGEKWPQILAVIDVFESDKAGAALPLPKTDPPVVFLGHGRSGAWKELRDHLQDKHGFKIEAYEIGARSGHTIRDILESMLAKSSIAFLVMTGEDSMASGDVHPRLNVVHEAGLFQGRLGFNRAIVLLEEGVTEFSNIKGIEQIRFTNIKEVFGDVIATVRREFSD